MNQKFVNLSVLGAAMSGAVACGPGPRMVAPAEMAEKASVLEVADRSSMTGAMADESFKLGNYSVEEVDRDWNSSKSAGIGGWGKDSKTTGYTYQLKTQSGTWKGTCASLAEGQSVGSLSFGNSTNLTCECKLGDQSSTMQVSGETEASSGTYKSKDADYQVKAIQETDKSYFGSGPAGYRVDKNATPIGAVEVIRPGRVWLAEDLSPAEADKLTCTFAGMMLYLPPSDH